MNRVQELRRGSGLTQRELALLLGVTVTSLSAWERGVSVPHPRHQRALAKRFNVTVEDLGFS